MTDTPPDWMIIERYDRETDAWLSSGFCTPGSSISADMDVRVVPGYRDPPPGSTRESVIGVMVAFSNFRRAYIIEHGGRPSPLIESLKAVHCAIDRAMKATEGGE